MLTRRGLIAGLAAGAALLPATRLGAAPLARVQELGVLRIGVYRDNRPWSWSENGGAPQGIDVDLARALAATLGVRAEVVEFLAGEDLGDDLRNVVWRGGLLGFQPCDVMMHVPFDRRLQIDNDQVVLLAPYYRENFAAVCGAEQSDCDVPPPQFKGKRLAAELDSIPDMYLLGGFGGVLRSDVRHYPTGDAAVRAVRSGEADVAVATRAQVEHVTAEPNSQGLKRRRAPLQAIMSPGWDIGLAVKENSRSLGDALDRTIEAMAADGRMTALFARHGVEWKPAVAAQPAGE
ncbi:amino acid ABC transporter substrate-binding protein (PAAT family) [Novosphingobium kunmingense]|uniref:Amino acid ABC transporter substrate-binding protein (PAAT family) n=1 Tax=Novosphingobium kunmingense TaxID=1211806 RepID=A0A2N0H6E4_9SPHN|nr:transporter substrate-binding domain-containing protein [Novosphingobium kunmingense]PKB14487.1 amino acid ABC transporter substrate-binding protein (PAAT family) [Novosphingobium kunmingense]